MNLGRLTDGGSGLVFQKGTPVERRGCGTVGDIGIWDDAAVPHLRRLVDIMQDCGAVPGIQLMHAGRKARQKPPDHAPQQTATHRQARARPAEHLQYQAKLQRPHAVLYTTPERAHTPPPRNCPSARAPLHT